MKNIPTEKLKVQANEIRAELDRRELIERRLGNAKLVGKYFKYRNSYGIAGRNDWWLYKHVLRLDGYGFRCVRFQEDEEGRFESEGNHYCHGFLDGCIEISKKEYCKALRSFQTRMKSALSFSHP